MQHVLAVASVATVVSFACCSTIHAEDEWQSIKIMKADDVVCRLKVRKTASLADVDWIAIEFENSSKQPIRVDSVHYRISQECFSLKTNKPVSSGSLASGSGYDLFPDAWKTRPVADRFLKSGVYRASKQPSLYSSALLQLPPKDGLRVKATIHVYIRTEKLYQGSADFQFDWHFPEPANWKTMKSQLHQWLKKPEEKAAHGYILGTYLSLPEVADGLTAEQLISALAHRNGAFSGREAVLTYINAKHSKDPQTQSFFLQQLKRGNKHVLDDLRKLTNVWQKDHQREVLRLMRDPSHGHGRSLFDGLALFRIHGTPQRKDRDLAKRLAEILKPTGVALQKNPEPYYAAQMIDMLAQAHHPDVVKYIRPSLDNRKLTDDPNKISRTLTRGEDLPKRVCDHALNAILTILDGSPQNAYAKHGAKPRRFSWSDEDRAAILKIRDKMIVELKARLKEPDESK